MKTVIARSFKSLETFLKKQSSLSKNLGLVPTMGSLHEGHLSLIKKSKSTTSCTIVSIFLNPIQFNNKSDFMKYPKQEKKDIELLKKYKVDLIFIPKTTSVYPKNYSTYLHEVFFSSKLCGEVRGDHFSGVTTVVLKLFLLINPTKAFFGEKDYQQLLIIKKIVKDLCLKINIVMVPTVRDSHGLALSSRNRLLSDQNLLKARKLFKTLKKVKFYKNKSVKTIKKSICEDLNKEGIKNIEYLVILEIKSFKEPKMLDKKKENRIFIATRIGGVRLIDNYRIV